MLYRISFNTKKNHGSRSVVLIILSLRCLLSVLNFNSTISLVYGKRF